MIYNYLNIPYSILFKVKLMNLNATNLYKYEQLNTIRNIKIPIIKYKV